VPELVFGTGIGIDGGGYSFDGLSFVPGPWQRPVVGERFDLRRWCVPADAEQRPAHHTDRAAGGPKLLPIVVGKSRAKLSYPVAEVQVTRYHLHCKIKRCPGQAAGASLLSGIAVRVMIRALRVLMWSFTGESTW
jgi:hypothetical protein